MKVQHAVLRPGKRGVASLAAFALLAVAIVTSAAATPGTPVSISNTVTSFDPGAVSDFASTGGVLCASGTVSNRFERFVGWQSNLHSQILVGKRFVCGDGSGTFDFLLRVTLDFGAGDTAGTWSVVGGSGKYEQLHGGGAIQGERLPDGGIEDVYEGTVHVD